MTETTKAQKARDRKALAIHENPDAHEVTYISPQLIQCTLPHSNPGSTLMEWRRSDGNQTLTIRPASNAKNEALYPFGSYPRLLLFWMTEEAITTGRRWLNLGRSMNQFTGKVGLDITGGKDAARFKDQMSRLFDSSISFEYRGETFGRKQKMEITNDIIMWWDAKRSDEENIFASSVQLGEKFYDCITERRPVPLDYRVIDGIKQSPLAIDLYTTMTYTAYETQRKHKKELILWTDLHRKLGSEYKDLKKFREKARRALKEIVRFYPQLRVDPLRPDYLTVHPSPTSIPQSKAFIIDSRVIEAKPEPKTIVIHKKAVK